MKTTFNSVGLNIECNKYVNISRADNIPSDISNQLTGASGVIGRYAKDKGVKINIMGLPYDDLVDISVKNSPCFKRAGWLHYNEKSDKPFLRRVYENIQLFTEGTEPRIEKMKAETLEKLRKIGKIK